MRPMTAKQAAPGAGAGRRRPRRRRATSTRASSRARSSARSSRGRSATSPPEPRRARRAREADAPLDPAELHAQQLRAARQSGYQDGYRDGLVALEGFKQSFASQTTTQVGALVRSVGEQLDALQQEMARALAATATALARQVLRSELAARPECVDAGRRAGARRAAAERAPHRAARPSRRPRARSPAARPRRSRRAARASSPIRSSRAAAAASNRTSAWSTRRIDERWRRAVASLGSDLPWQDAAVSPSPVIPSEAKDPGDG